MIFPQIQYDLQQQRDENDRQQREKGPLSQLLQVDNIRVGLICRCGFRCVVHKSSTYKFYLSSPLSGCNHMRKVTAPEHCWNNSKLSRTKNIQNLFWKYLQSGWFKDVQKRSGDRGNSHFWKPKYLDYQILGKMVIKVIWLPFLMYNNIWLS